MIETPGLLTCSARYADQHRSELAQHVRSGGVVRIVDLRNRKVLEYRSQERPACLAGMPDDLPALWQAQHERWSTAAKTRDASHLVLAAAAANARRQATPDEQKSQNPDAVRKRRYRERKRQETAESAR